MFLCFTIILSLVISGANAAESGSAYKGASSWAVPELDKASGYGLITERIKDNISTNITREEFAEIAVRFYEVYTGKRAEPGNAKFSDTSNPEILKAANLGLTSGIGDGKFGPNQLVTREQIATMLVRALKVVRPDADYSSAGSAKFTDDNLIEDWAREGVYYCAKSGIIKGIQNNDGTFRFDPDGNSSREVAVIVVTRAYEYFINEANKQEGGSSSGTQEMAPGMIRLQMKRTGTATSSYLTRTLLRNSILSGKLTVQVLFTCRMIVFGMFSECLTPGLIPIRKGR